MSFEIKVCIATNKIKKFKLTTGNQNAFSL